MLRIYIDLFLRPHHKYSECLCGGYNVGCILRHLCEQSAVRIQELSVTLALACDQ